MFLFCPVCNNLLEVGEEDGRYIFVCVACPYKCQIKGAYRFPFYTKLKEADEVLHEADAWKNAQTTTINCPSCDHTKAYYQELQTRSADEPATIFYRCCECQRTWKSD